MLQHHTMNTESEKYLQDKMEKATAKCKGNTRTVGALWKTDE